MRPGQSPPPCGTSRVQGVLLFKDRCRPTPDAVETVQKTSPPFVRGCSGVNRGPGVSDVTLPGELYLNRCVVSVLIGGSQPHLLQSLYSVLDS